MPELPLLSIVIATFNSEKTLPLVLRSIEQQTISRNRLEILLVDGGSQDSTLELGKQFHCKVIPNPRTEPVYAKFLGYRHAQGRYVSYIDHDEVLENPTSIEKKLNAFQQNQNLRVVIGSGYKCPAGYSFITQYINEFGEPFSFFMYRLSKDVRFFVKQMKRRYIVVAENDDVVLLSLSNTKQRPIIELAAMASMFDAAYLKKHFSETLEKPELLPHYFYLLYSKAPILAITRKDAVLHYSSETFKKYFTKINWRVKNNIYHKSDMGMSGFSGREKFQPVWARFKKYFFIPYALSLVLPCVDALVLMATRKESRYCLHIPLSFSSAVLILWHYTLKIFRYHPKLKSYDGSKIVQRV